MLVSLSDSSCSTCVLFISGDVQLEIQGDDESPIDSYEVKLSNSDVPGEFDWDNLPISPLRRRRIVVESKARNPPTRDKEIIIIEREEPAVTVATAVELGK